MSFALQGTIHLCFQLLILLVDISAVSYFNCKTPTEEVSSFKVPPNDCESVPTFKVETSSCFPLSPSTKSGNLDLNKIIKIIKVSAWSWYDRCEWRSETDLLTVSVAKGGRLELSWWSFCCGQRPLESASGAILIIKAQSGSYIDIHIKIH